MTPFLFYATVLYMKKIIRHNREVALNPQVILWRKRTAKRRAIATRMQLRLADAFKSMDEALAFLDKPVEADPQKRSISQLMAEDRYKLAWEYFKNLIKHV